MRQTAGVKSLLVIALFCTASLAQSQVVHRCLDGDGRRVYSDRACEHLGLRGEQARETPADSEVPLELEAASGPVAAAQGCPGPTPDALRERVAEALERRDLNALNGMYHWAGAGRHTAGAVVTHFQQLIAARPQTVILRQAAHNDDWLWAGLPPPSESAPPELLALPDALSDDRPLARFNLRRQAGCYWLVIGDW